MSGHSNNVGMTSLNKTRSTEWLLAVLLLLWGAEIMRPAPVFEAPVYGLMRELLRETTWGAIAIIIGALRLLGLGINGWWRRSPLIRLVGSLGSGLFWMALCVLMFTANRKFGGYLPIGVTAFYPVFFIFEGWCVAAAGYDMQKNGSLTYRSA
ncbi:hypothetical protein FHR71_005630 [Methylobacterium sp. RAS18]|nr:hypothetical protein [Methylobacterium sp. RAS18]